MVYYSWNSYKLGPGPLDIFDAFSNERNLFFLHSSLNADNALGRYSFFGIDPFYIFQAKDKDPFGRLRGLLERYKMPPLRNALPFCGGAVGYFSYDIGFLLEEKLKRKNEDDLDIPGCLFGFYNTVAAIDNIKRRLYIFTLGFPETKYNLQKALCRSNLKKIKKILSGAKPKRRPAGQILRRRVEIESNFSRRDYIAAVIKAKQYIKDGDIYQLNLSQRFQADTGLASGEIYKRLSRVSPSYFSAYFDAGDFQIISSSPERFLKLEADVVTTRPMKGTRGRSQNRLADAGLRNSLLESAKDKAELMMIVDLERNDLGRVCKYDSVKVNTLRELEEYSTVYQTTASIEGRLPKNRDRIDLLRACFPGGSITGCPKIRAMQIIEELEPHRRNIYTGALGYLGYSQNMDFNILIRTILKKGKRAYFGAGGGIVADSDPEGEYEETLVKAKAMIEALK